ncbi:hypothetical protein GUJ93_ZPchr0004g39656 [Zizania palustris]|uniref:Uncharacterized protein n=1 Tax=Zizania palustris TaxID=103762 RepID=A0A8J5S6N5_ZIZPA|nr:hypothetical protein GUJ93_ZPchr0004g39656 [Zizania palustris]
MGRIGCSSERLRFNVSEKSAKIYQMSVASMAWNSTDERVMGRRACTDAAPSAALMAYRCDEIEAIAVN